MRSAGMVARPAFGGGARRRGRPPRLRQRHARHHFLAHQFVLVGIPHPARGRGVGLVGELLAEAKTLQPRLFGRNRGGTRGRRHAAKRRLMKADARGGQDLALPAAEEHDGTGRHAVLLDKGREPLGADQIRHPLRLENPAAHRIQPHRAHTAHRVEKPVEFVGIAEGDAAGEFQHLAVRQHLELMRPDAGVAVDDLPDAGELRGADEQAVVGEVDHAEHGDGLGETAPEIFAARSVIRGRTPDADRLPHREQRHHDPGRDQRHQPQHRLRLAAAMDGDVEGCDRGADQNAADETVEPVGFRQRQFAEPVPHEIISRRRR